MQDILLARSRSHPHRARWRVREPSGFPRHRQQNVLHPNDRQGEDTSGRRGRSAPAATAACPTLLAVWPGLRRSEIRALRWADLDLDGRLPKIRLRAEATKSRRADTLALHPQLAEALREARPENADERGRVVRSVPDMKAFRADLRFADIDPGDESSGYVDLHALRMTLSTMMAAAGMSQRARQAHMRHTDPRLTETIYMDERLLPVAEELGRLPALGEQAGDAERAVTKPDADDEATRNIHERIGTNRPEEAQADNSHCHHQHADRGVSREKEGAQTADMAGEGTKRQGRASPDARPDEERVMGFEPTTFTLATKPGVPLVSARS